MPQVQGLHSLLTYHGFPPPAGDLAFNVALGATLVALPLTIGAVARTAFVKYKFTDKRVSVITTAPWESEWLAAVVEAG